jgi:hypothetical protein
MDVPVKESERSIEGGGDRGDGGGRETELGGPADRDRDELSAMLKEVHDLLGEIIQRGGWLPDDFQPMYLEALRSIEGNFLDVDRALSDAAINERLASVGLIGAPWRLKHGVWELFKGLARTGKTGAVLVLRVADTIIGSVAVVIPVAEGITEVKEMVEHGIRGKTLLDQALRDEGGDQPAV